MERERILLSREQLYELVWSRPLSKLAAEYDISDVGLAKICKRMEVPLPGREYWGRDRHGRSKTPLPEASSDQQEVALWKSTMKKNAESPPDPPDISVPKNLKNPHPLITRTEKGLARARADRLGMISPRGKAVLAVEVSKSNSKRALRLLNALLKECEIRGHSISAGDSFRPETQVTIHGETVSISLKERLVRSDHVLTPEEEERDARYGWSASPRFDFEPSGLLRFRVEGIEGTGGRQSWSDGSRTRLERKLGKVVVGIEAAADIQRERRLHQAAERERWELEWQKREEARRRKEEEGKRISELKTMTSDWGLAEQARSFLKAVEDAVPQDHQNQELSGWIDWAHEAVDRMDPVKRITVENGVPS